MRVFYPLRVKRNFEGYKILYKYNIVTSIYLFIGIYLYIYHITDHQMRNLERDPDNRNDNLSTMEVVHIIFVTLLSIVIFLSMKVAYDKIQQQWSHVTLVVIGGGPVGLLSAIIGMKTGHIVNVIIYEEKVRSDLFNQPHQIALDNVSVKFLHDIGVDFDNIEGCWQDGCFFTRIGVFIEYLLNLVQCHQIPTKVIFNKKVSVAKLFF